MEMHTEVHKHKIKDGGEDGIWETAGMAICLGVVQNYTFQEQPSGRWAMVFNPKSDDDEDGGLFGASGDKTPEEQAKVVQGLLLTKEVGACRAPGAAAVCRRSVRSQLGPVLRSNARTRASPSVGPPSRSPTRLIPTHARPRPCQVCRVVRAEEMQQDVSPAI